MKKVLVIGAFWALSIPSFADDKGTQKDYYGTVTCPNGDRITVEGRCCEPGGLFYCGYVSCQNYTPVGVTCLSSGG
ncbi:MAG: hypothetical protein KGZ90_13960 [Algoriphagus sp.]|nr:hypothetical protein [Algoriphagus sp.]